MHEIHHVAHGFDKLLQLRFSHHQRRRHFQHHEVVSADLRENALIAKQPHHQNLAEHCRMYAAEALERDAQAKLPRRGEFDAAEHAETADGAHHFVRREGFGKLLAQARAHIGDPRSPSASCSNTSSVASPARMERPFSPNVEA